MKSVWTGATFAIALGCAVTMSAQSGSTTGSQTAGANRTITVTGCLQGNGSTPGATGTSGTAGPASVMPRAIGTGTFTLTNARMGSGAVAGSTATSGPAAGATTSPGSSAGGSTPSAGSTGSTSGAAGSTAGTAGSGSSGSMAMSGSTYVLQGRDTELAPHNGHQVEVTGSLIASPSGSGSASGAPGTTAGGSTTGTGSSASGSAASGSSASGASGMSTGSQNIQVASVRMIASTCSTQ